MSSYKLAGSGAAVLIGPSPTALLPVCDASANWSIDRNQDVQEEVTYCAVEPIPGAKKGSISFKMFMQRRIGEMVQVKLSNPGSGYGVITPPTISFSGGGAPQQATAIAVLDGNGGLKSIFVTSPGIGYTGAPTMTITGAGTGVGYTIVMSTYNMDWLEDLLNGVAANAGQVFYELRPEGSGTGKPAYAGYFIPNNNKITAPSDKGAIYVETGGVTNGWAAYGKQP